MSGYPVRVNDNSNLMRVAPILAGGKATYRAALSMGLAATPTDILVLNLTNEEMSVVLRKITIQLFADSAGTVPVPVSVVLSGTNSGGTSTAVPTGAMDLSNVLVVATLNRYTANPTLGGSRSVVDYAEAMIGTNAAPAETIVFDYTTPGAVAPRLRSIYDSNARTLNVNLGGATFGANPRAVVTVEYAAEPVEKIIFFGDSLIQGASNLQNAMKTVPDLCAYRDVRFYGNTGKRLLDMLPIAAANTSGITYTFAALLSSTPSFGSSVFRPTLINHFLTNDVRTGACTLAEAISLLDAWIYIVKNGCTSGQTWVSTKTGGAGTSFTWNATLPAKPHAKIVLWGPNSYLADDPTAGSFITATGAFSGMILAQAAQAATDIVYNAHAAFIGDSRVDKVIQAQDYISPSTGFTFGRTVAVGSLNKLMTDTLHPNSTGQFVKWEQAVEALALWRGA